MVRMDTNCSILPSLFINNLGYDIIIVKIKMYAFDKTHTDIYTYIQIYS